jgi:hypothetical protein
MTGRITPNKKNIIKNKNAGSFSHSNNSMVNKIEISPIFAKLAEEGQEDYYNYLDWLGLAKDPDFLILASSHHYYFENEDLKTIKTVVNLKQLNDIIRIEDFLNTIHSVLPLKCYFVGSFTDNRNQNGSSVPSNQLQNKITEKFARFRKRGAGSITPLLNMLNNIFEPGANKYMTEKTVRLLFQNTGLKILDLTDFKGITYFCTQKDKSSAE